MNGNKYQSLAMRTNDGKAEERLETIMKGNSFAEIGEILNAALGLSGEVGELNDMIKKFVYHQKPMDEDHFKRELGDICWYIAMMCDACGYNLEDIMKINIEKLKARYPEGFDTNLANNRALTDI